MCLLLTAEIQDSDVGSKRVCDIFMTGTDVRARKKSGCLNAGFVSGSLEKNSCYYLSAKLIFN